MNKESVPYRSLCTEYYELDKPSPPADALKCYLNYAKEAGGSILERMCGLKVSHSAFRAGIHSNRV